jgi:hypothetical protein
MNAHVVVLVFTDGRDYIFETLPAWREILAGATVLINDDSADPAHGDRLEAAFPDYAVLRWESRGGFGGAISRAWDWAGLCDPEYIFHLEDDFLPVDVPSIDALAGLLARHPELVQVALLRQAWNSAEVEAGGLIEMDPAGYEVRGDSYCSWLEHRKFFTTNPSLYRASLLRFGWPAGERSEGVFTHRLLLGGSPEVWSGAVRFAYWGGDRAPRVSHIGHLRIGKGY